MQKTVGDIDTAREREQMMVSPFIDPAYGRTYNQIVGQSPPGASAEEEP
jgi:hypothetical protein